jgi:hypothetical protein
LALQVKRAAHPPAFVIARALSHKYPDPAKLLFSRVTLTFEQPPDEKDNTADSKHGQFPTGVLLLHANHEAEGEESHAEGLKGLCKVEHENITSGILNGVLKNVERF